jgi:hypothetical protein
VVAGVVAEGADVPLLDHVPGAGVVGHAILKQIVVPNVTSVTSYINVCIGTYTNSL